MWNNDRSQSIISRNQNFEQTTGQILNERESLLRVIRVIALIARRDDARATSRVDNESHGKSANARGIQSPAPGRGHVVGIVSRAHPERTELIRVGKRAIHVCRACHAWLQLHQWWEDTRAGRKGSVAFLRTKNPWPNSPSRCDALLRRSLQRPSALFS